MMMNMGFEVGLTTCHVSKTLTVPTKLDHLIYCLLLSLCLTLKSLKILISLALMFKTKSTTLGLNILVFNKNWN